MFHKRAILILSAILLTGCSENNSESKDKTGMLMLDALEVQNKEPKTYEVKERDLSASFSVTAKLYNEAKYTVSTESDNCSYMITEVKKGQGSLVKAGDVLLTIVKQHDEIDEKETELKYNRKKLAIDEEVAGYDEKIEKAEAEYAKSGSEVDRLTVVKLTLEKEIYLSDAEKELQSIAEVLEDYRSTQTTVTLVAEHAGLLTYNNDPYVGMKLIPGTSVGSIMDTEEYYYLVSEDAKTLYPGQDITMKSEDGIVVEGTVICDDKFINYDFGGALVDIKTVNGEDYTYDVLPETVSLDIKQTSWENALCVSDAAIQTDKNGGKYVNRKTEDGSERVYVTIAGSLSGYTWITEGLCSGDICLVNR